MRKLPVLLTLMAVLTLGASAPAATPRAADLVQAELLADVSAVRPGEEFTLGVLLKIKPKWHIYWKYPGDAGLPTTVKWTLPDESTPQPALRFPLPVRFDQPGDVVGYGYTNEVLLTARVKAPRGDVGASHEFTADVSYLVCEDICIPGKASVKLSLPLAEENKPANAELFGKWLALVPKPGGGLELERTGDREFTARLAFPQAQTVSDVQWFPLPPRASGVEDAQTTADGNRSVFTFSLVPLPKDSGKMQFLVTYTDSSGKRQGVEFDQNLPASLPK